jgi:glycosyltransferase involved in cell wall biosynthesis
VNAIAQLVADTLDELPVTDRVFHHLNASSPLVVEILRRVASRQGRGERLLLIGGNALLGHALVAMGFDLEIWFFREGFLTDELQARVTREITPAELTSGAISRGSSRYEAVIFPLLLESLTCSPRDVLGALRERLVPDGQLIAATGSLTRLEMRLAALSGKNFAPLAAPAPQLSLSWPALGTVREYHRDDLVRSCRDAGFRIRECSYVVASKPFVALDSFGLPVYTAHKLRQVVKHVVPSTRDVLLLDLSPQRNDRPSSNGSLPCRVSVIVSATRGPTALARILESLEDQTYPSEQYEVIVLHNSSSPDSVAVIQQREQATQRVIRALHVADPEGPSARNEGMSHARGEICAHTDDACEVPPDWIQGAVGWFDDNTAVVGGTVFAKAGSVPRYMDPPGSRPDGDDKGVFPKGLFPISNVFYRRSTVEAVGGFNESYCDNSANHCLGWDTELAWRIRNQGWLTRFREDVYVFRDFHTPDRLRWLPRQWHQAQHLPQMVAQVEPLGRELLTARVFASNYTMYFDLLLVSLVAAVFRGRPLYALPAIPWLLAVSQRLDFWPPSQWRGSARLLAARGLRHVTWLAAFLYGSVRAKRLVL